uniref:Uncharacterized protein n=1 Tax=Picea glauca TaxID=3330 RepID=A0A101LWV0_PICGL|nr:hypothetical protein ABT39_MTgene1313 [Picea glauca]QHR89540.1 hypothetical protein Q903MT_gene3562 [Picea sitchensis]
MGYSNMYIDMWSFSLGSESLDIHPILMSIPTSLLWQNLISFLLSLIGSDRNRQTLI